MRKTLATFSVALAMVLGASISTPAHAKLVCHPYERMVSILKDNHNETLRHSGEGPHGVRLEVYASDEGTWTMIFIYRSGKTCANGINGINWNADAEAVEEAPPKPTRRPALRRRVRDTI